MEINNFIKIDPNQIAPLSITDVEALSQTNKVMTSLIQSLAKTAESIVATAQDNLHPASTEEDIERELLEEFQKMLQMRAICDQAVQDMAKNIGRGKSKSTEGYDLN